MGQHVVVGAGPVGTATAELLLARGEQVRVVTRSGSGPDGAERVAADASDAGRMRELATGADAVYNCVNPPYHQWAAAWPPIAAALLGAAEAAGAVLATTGNLYTYGRVSGPMTEATPERPNGTKGAVRARMWAEAKAAHDAGRVRALEVRGSDYVGTRENSFLSTVIVPRLRAGKSPWIPADLDAPHTWTDTRDVAALLVAAVSDERGWGRVWHVPSDAPRSARELTAMTAERLGVSVRPHALPYAAVWAAGLTDLFVRELRETQYQFRAPFVLDSSAAQQTFGLRPTPLGESVDHTLTLV